MEAIFDFRLAGGFEEQLDRFDEIPPGFLNGRALTGDIEFGAKRDVVVALALDQDGEFLSGCLRSRSL